MPGLAALINLSNHPAHSWYEYLYVTQACGLLYFQGRKEGKKERRKEGRKEGRKERRKEGGELQSWL